MIKVFYIFYIVAGIQMYLEDHPNSNITLSTIMYQLFEFTVELISKKDKKNKIDYLFFLI